MPYFNDLSHDDKNSLQFSFKHLNLSKGSEILNQGETAKQMIIICKGIVEVHVNTKKSNSTTDEFIIDYLGRGSILHHTMVLLS